MKNFKYQIGQDCWMVNPGYGHQLYRCFVQSRIIEEMESGIKYKYRVKLEGSSNEVEVDENHLFDVATRCNDALCFLQTLLKKSFLIFLFLLPLSLFSQKLILRNKSDTTITIFVNREKSMFSEVVTLRPGQRAEIALCMFYGYSVRCDKYGKEDFTVWDDTIFIHEYYPPEPNKA